MAPSFSPWIHEACSKDVKRAPEEHRSYDCRYSTDLFYPTAVWSADNEKKYTNKYKNHINRDETYTRQKRHILDHEVMENTQMSKQFIHKGTRTEVHNRGGRHTRIERETTLTGRGLMKKKTTSWDHVHVSMEYITGVIKPQQQGIAVWFGTSPDCSCRGGRLDQRKPALGNRVGRCYTGHHQPSQSGTNSLTSSVADTP